MTTLRRGPKRIASWIDAEKMPTMRWIVARYLPKALDTESWLLYVDGPTHSETYAFDFETRQFVAVESRRGFA